MHPEQEIVGIWLRQQGFFTANSINAGGNLVIDTLAVKLHQGTLEKALHVEVCRSVRLAKKERDELRNRFESPAVVKQAREYLRKAVGKDVEYERLLVVNGGVLSLPGIEVRSLQDVLLDVLARLDRQDYGDAVTRTLQLVKFTILPSAQRSALLLSQGGSQRRLLALVEQIVETHLNERERAVLRDLLQEPSSARPAHQKTLGTFDS